MKECAFHSKNYIKYKYVPDDKSHIAATSKYGIEFPSVISKDNIHGIQCHPEKSHDAGFEFLRRFSEQ